MIDALEANLWEMQRDFARIDGAEVHDEPDLLWYTTPSNSGWLNGASRARLGDDADERIAHVVAAIHARGASVLWHVTPSSTPADLGERLARAGLAGSPAPGMALELADWSNVVPPELEIRTAANEDDVLEWVSTFDRSFGIAPRGRAHPWLGSFTQLGVGPSSPCRLFVGRVGDEPVACSLAFAWRDTVGLYGVGSVPDRRGRGYGAAITGAGIEWGREHGAAVAVLSATELGEPVYRRMGFRSVCETSLWSLAPPA